MRQAHYTLEVPTRGRELYDVTRSIVDFVQGSEIQQGLLTVFIQHTSASLLINENADPEVLRDLERFFARLVPDGDTLYRHVEEGPDDMPAHVRCALTQTQLSIPVRDGRPTLGTWQGIFLYEHRHASHTRKLSLQIMGE